MPHTKQPSREEFITYWKDYDSTSWRKLVPYALYLGCLAIYAFVVRQIDAEGRYWVFSLIIAIAYVVLIPYLYIKRIQTRYARFIRCPKCGDWFAQDSSGAYRGPNPKFKLVILSGKCSKCGQQILAET